MFHPFLSSRQVIRMLFKKRLALAVIATLVGCSGSTKPDATPPAAVTDLTVAAIRDTAVTLTWTAPGDDGDRGRATAYDLRYSRFSTLTYWDMATSAPSPTPGAAGGTDSIVVAGLLQEAVYNFAIRTVDKAGNWSKVSNMVSGGTDLTPPEVISDLRGIAISHTTIQLHWSAPGDDGDVGLVDGYDIRYATAPLGESDWNTYRQAPFTQTPVESGKDQAYSLVGLEPISTYYIAVRARDEVGHVARISNMVEVTTKPDMTPPGVVQDLFARFEPPVSTILTWTAPGDDGDHGQATAYDIRYSDTPITEATWEMAIPISPPIPGPADSAEHAHVDSLVEGAMYYFALKARDEVDNESALSNVAVSSPIDPRLWHVYMNGIGDTPTIQSAINRASITGDTVLVHPGLYREKLRFGEKGICLLSVAGPDSTILDASTFPTDIMISLGPSPYSSSIRGFTISGTVSNPAIRTEGARLTFRDNVVEGNHGVGLTVAGGAALILNNRFENNDHWTVWPSFGASIVAESVYEGVDVHLVISGNLFANNRAGFGPALELGSGQLEFRDNILRDNWCAFDGGAVFIWTSLDHAFIEDNEFWQNTAGDHGGAIAVWNRFSGESEIRGNLFVGNRAMGGDANGMNGTGGALHISGYAGIVERNTIVQSDGTIPCAGGGISIDLSEERHGDWLIRRNVITSSAAGGIVCMQANGVIIERNILWNNGSCGNISRCPEDILSGNLIADPLFCDPMNGDYRVAENSPALSGAIPIGAYPEPGCWPSQYATGYRMEK